MPPPTEKACRLISAEYREKAELIDKLKKIKKSIDLISAIKTSAKFGINIADNFASEALTSIEAVAAQAAKNVMSNSSKMASNVFEFMYQALLKIFLMAPTGVFSLVAIPHEAAIDAASSEMNYIRKAEENLGIVIRIIVKWTKGRSGSEYYDQITRALPYITNAIKLTKGLIDDLNLSAGDDSGIVNAKFNKANYESLKSNINVAIELTTPSSVIQQRSSITKRIEETKKKKYDEKASKINSDYRADLDGLNKWYQDKLDVAYTRKDSSIPDKLSNQVEQAAIRAEYGQRLKLIDLKKKERLSIADIKSEAEALADSETWISAYESIKDQFSRDIITLGKNLEDFLKNIKNAFLSYKECQLYCNNIYDMKNLIKVLIKEIVGYLRDKSNDSADDIEATMIRVKSILEFVETKFKNISEEYVSSGQNVSSTRLTGTLATGHGGLLSADMILSAAITQSLIEIMNSDDLIEDQGTEFDEFVKRLAGIPDWDGKLKMWSVDMALGATAPYVQLISDATSMLAKIPFLSASNKESDRARINELVSKSRNNFTIIRSHNIRVSGVLSSYTPYSGSEITDLKRILSNCGLLRGFAAGMSLVTFVNDVLSIVGEGDGGEPTYENCRDFYPELFNDDAILKGQTINGLNLMDPLITGDGSQKSLDDNDLDTRILMAKLSNLNLSTGHNDDLFGDGSGAA